MILGIRSFIFLGLLGLFSLSAAMNRQQEEENSFDLVSREHQLAIPEHDRKKEPFIPVFINKDGSPRDPTAEEFIRSEFEGKLYETYRNQFIAACNSIKESEYFPLHFEHLEIDEATRSDLKILRGGPAVTDGPDCLANTINKTHTFAGRAVLGAQLAKPPAAVDKLISRTQKINSLVRLPRFNVLESHLKKAAEGESIYLSFGPGDRFEEHLMRSKRKIMGSDKLACLKRFENWLNDNPLYLTWQEAEPVIMSAPVLALSAAVKVFELGKIFTGPNKFENCWKFCKGIGIEAISPIDKPVINVAEKFCPKLFVNFLKLVFSTKGIEQQVDGVANTRMMLGYQFSILKYMRKRLFYASKIVRSFQDIQKELQQISADPNGAMLVNLSLPQSPKAKQTVELLTSSTFDNDDEGWLAYWGKIKLAYKRMCETKNEFRKSYAALGELDFLMGSARLIRDNPAPFLRDSTQKAKYSLATFIRNAQTPSLQAKNGWNPLIKDAQRVVLNDAKLSDSNGEKMLIITGPNGKGKTVFMNMILYGALMSQSLGVAPSQEFSLTPYNHLITFAKTETATSKGQSLFVNTCERGKVVIDTLNKAGFKLFGGDEPFPGTKHALAQSTVVEFAKKVGETPKVNGMITTHLKAVTRLPESLRVHFMNLKVNNHQVEQGIGDFETEDEGLRIIEEVLGQPFAQAVQNNMKNQSIYEYWEQHKQLDALEQAARQEYQALRQQAGAPTLDGIIANITDPELRAALDEKINNPSIAGIDSIINRLRKREFDTFFDLVGHVATLGQHSAEMRQQTFKELLLTVMAHCADATSTAQSAPWLARIRQVEANIAQEHERRLKLQQEIESLQHVRTQEPLAEQLQTERRALNVAAEQTREKVSEIDDVERELALRKKLRHLQTELSQQHIELQDAIEEARSLIDSLRVLPNYTQHQTLN